MLNNITYHKKVGFGVLKPCPRNLVLLSNVVQGNLLLDKDRVRANDALILSNCIQITSTLATVTFTGNEKYYLDIVRCQHSLTGAVFSETDNDLALYTITDNVVAFDKINEYYSKCQLIALIGGVEHNIATFLNSSGMNEESNIENQSETEGKVFLFGQFRTGVPFITGLGF